MTLKVENAAVFMGRSRRYKGANVTVFEANEEGPGEVVLTNRITHDELARYSVVEVAKAGMAWDIIDHDGERRRLTAQQGCGCSGMKPYTVDEGYSGTIA